MLPEDLELAAAEAEEFATEPDLELDEPDEAEMELPEEFETAMGFEEEGGLEAELVDEALDLGVEEAGFGVEDEVELGFGEAEETLGLGAVDEPSDDLDFGLDPGGGFGAFDAEEGLAEAEAQRPAPCARYRAAVIRYTRCWRRTRNRRCLCLVYRFRALYCRCLWLRTRNRRYLCCFYQYFAAYYRCLYNLTRQRRYLCLHFRFRANHCLCLFRLTRNRRYLCCHYRFMMQYCRCIRNVACYRRFVALYRRNCR